MERKQLTDVKSRDPRLKCFISKMNGELWTCALVRRRPHSSVAYCVAWVKGCQSSVAHQPLLHGFGLFFNLYLLLAEVSVPVSYFLKNIVGVHTSVQSILAFEMWRSLNHPLLAMLDKADIVVGLCGKQAHRHSVLKCGIHVHYCPTDNMKTQPVRKYQLALQ